MQIHKNVRLILELDVVEICGHIRSVSPELQWRDWDRVLLGAAEDFGGGGQGGGHLGQGADASHYLEKLRLCKCVFRSNVEFFAHDNPS